MKELRVTFTDDEHERLTNKKDGRTWHNAILEEFGVDQ